MIEINNFPIGQTVNQGLAFYKGRLIKSAKARVYEGAVNSYYNKHFQYLNIVRDKMKVWLEEGYCIKADYFFMFHEEHLIWKHKKTMRKLDVDNRIKPLQDALSKILNIDDTFFTCGYREKLIQDKDCQECVKIIFTKTKLRHAKELNLSPAS